MLCPMCNEPLKLHRATRSYHQLHHFKEVLGQSQGRAGEQIPREILDKIKFDLPIFREVTAIEEKKAIRKLKFTKDMQNVYHILFAMTGKQPPYPKRENEKGSSGCST